LRTQLHFGLVDVVSGVTGEIVIRRVCRHVEKYLTAGSIGSRPTEIKTGWTRASGAGSSQGVLDVLHGRIRQKSAAVASRGYLSVCIRGSQRSSLFAVLCARA